MLQPRAAAVTIAFSFCFLLNAQTQSLGKHVLTVDDWYGVHGVSDPQVSPDGGKIVYEVRSVDKKDDKQVSQLWLASWDGSENLQLTRGTESASSGRWSPDGNLITFVSSRPGEPKQAQIWAFDHRGGDAYQLTHLKNFGITSYDWAPDSKKLLLVLKEREEPEPEEGKPAPPPKPIVITRYHFKEDMEGYLSGTKHNHIYVLDLASGKLDQITSGDHDEQEAVWSPDGREIAYVSNTDKNPDRTLNTDVFVVDARPGATPRRLTTWKGPDQGPLSWSPDGRLIAYRQESDPKYFAYTLSKLAVVSVDGSSDHILTENVDRDAYAPKFSEDGKTVTFLVPDDRVEYPASASVTGGKVERLLNDTAVIESWSARNGHTAVLSTSDEAPPEVFALEGGHLRQISHQNDQWLSHLKLGAVQDSSWRSKDGTEVHGLLTLPPDYQQGKAYPALLRIHGGPNGQDGHDFRFDNQLFAANGYVVLNVNYRGSSGRGWNYSKAIFADWGDKEVADLLSGVDHMVKGGFADPQKLGVGGWSYGAILTDYVIASDNRFKGAIAGAGSANWFGIYGIDEYTYQYEHELGNPWQNTQAWLKLSYPFFEIQRIHTPTLFMGGDKDFNVPIAGSEQMYQALVTIGVPTGLIIYPGEFHGFKRPSFIIDRYHRYLDWYAKYVCPPASMSAK